MNHSFACLLAATLSLAGGPRPAASPMPSPHLAGDVEIIVDGAPRPRYAHDGRWYVEAHKGREYAIRLRNPYAVRVGVALSVDGLNTIDARETTAAGARKWVLGPFETVVISGWQTSHSEARRFEFTTEERSYGQALGKTSNLGMISAVFFKERVPVMSLNGEAKRQSGAPRRSAPGEQAEGAPAASASSADSEYAATGMGRRTGHEVEQVWLSLEEVPAQAVKIRYEFHAQLVRLGVLPADRSADALQRREAARGFEPGYCPEPPRHR